MRVLLDENLPVGLAAHLSGHFVETVAGLGWSGVTNGELLRRARDNFDALLTMDSKIEFQQAITTQTLAVVVIRAPSNRMRDLVPLVSRILTALDGIGPGEIRRAVGWPDP